MGTVPFAGMVLADFGCDVIRVDAPTVKRGRTSAAPWVDSLCRRKSSIVVDFKSPASRRAFLDLVDVADVLIESYPPGEFDCLLGMTAEEELRKRNPRLIYARLTGFSRHDPIYATKKGHEPNLLAVSGVLGALMSLGDERREMSRPNIPLFADFGGGSLACVVGILMALLHRTITGKGQVVDASVTDSVSYLATFARQRAKGQPPGEPSLDVESAPEAQVYPTLDRRYMLLASLEPNRYERMVRGLGLDPTAIPSREDRKNWSALRNLLAARFASQTQEYWRRVFDDTDAGVTPVLHTDDVDVHKPLVQLSQTPSLAVEKEFSIPDLQPGDGDIEVLRRWLGPRKDSLKIDGTTRVCSRKERVSKL